MIFDVQAICEKGPIRPNNEDAIRYGHLEEQNCFWMVVADGMGGHKAGEIASHMFVESVEQNLKRILPKNSKSWAENCEEIFTLANQEIFHASEANSEYQGMGTTGVLLVYAENQIHVSWVGDSRVYRLRENKLEQLTQDHTMIQYLLDKGAISESEAARSNTKHLLSRALGIKEKVMVDNLSFSARAEDVFMLSSDGIHDALADGVIAGYMTQAKNKEQTAKALAKEAVSQGSRDNLTAGIIVLKESHGLE